jgi:hypothetical protein
MYASDNAQQFLLRMRQDTFGERNFVYAHDPIEQFQQTLATVIRILPLGSVHAHTERLVSAKRQVSGTLHSAAHLLVDRNIALGPD